MRTLTSVMAMVLALAGSSLSLHSSQAAELPVVEGKVVAIEAKTDNLTIAHDAIPNLDVGATTMVFKAANSNMIKKIKMGEKVRFSAVRMNGQPTITSLISVDALLSGESCE